MMKKLKILLITMALILTMPLTAYADTGPKPSVQIKFADAPEGIYYATLLSKNDSTGPSSAWYGEPAFAYYEHGPGGYEIWKKFVEYEDKHGYYFLQEWWECSETNQLNWTYYPPSHFKILLYFPETDTFAESTLRSRYAFDSYFTVDLTHWESGVVATERSYDYTAEVVNLILRIILTIMLELVIAWLYHLHQFPVFLFIAAVNLLTQIGLNVQLNIINYQSGPQDFVMNYILLEVGVMVAEAVLYIFLLSRIGRNPKLQEKAVSYAVVANAASFGIGLALAHVIPGIF